ncbi:hypothetical protein IQ268_01605 [Oculatella sp. LEGE 06141]|uniref:hypothetical protein n=1 Tax=Oculatella sp. LEGE 06141 TaxID=1828648 RepID=UPI001881984E|nr:hypothetical protein [Oculatella sp. LEGE 06141]MBE9177269.1 hypothetical protein [Oculatella sp. LEGE 06141]
MGRKRVTQLLEQLKQNQQHELENAAAIFTVAQVAVNELSSQATPTSNAAIAELPAAPLQMDKNELLQQYGSYNACRKAAKARGIKFSRTPSWQQIAAAFSYVESCQQVIQVYLDRHPSQDLKGVSIEVKLG